MDSGPGPLVQRLRAAQHRTRRRRTRRCAKTAGPSRPAQPARRPDRPDPQRRRCLPRSRSPSPDDRRLRAAPRGPLPALSAARLGQVVARQGREAVEGSCRRLGLAAWLLGSSAAKLATLDPTHLTEFGHLLETFVVGELCKQVSWLDEPVTIGHWRTDNDEVDLVVEFDDGGVVAFEVQANERIAGKDLGGLRKLRDTVGDRFIAGVAFSTGSWAYTFEDRIHVLPIDRLWRTVGT